MPCPSPVHRWLECLSEVGLHWTMQPGSPQRVKSLVVICPGGIGRQKLSIALKTIPLRLLGRWESARPRKSCATVRRENVIEAQRRFMDFIALIPENFRPRRVRMPIFSNQALRRLTMAVLAILGGKDVILDSMETMATPGVHPSKR